jgi:protein-S-isoprenylcysteine O-methyltransferase Ste14
MKNVIIFLFGIVAYVVFLVSFLYAIGFVGELLVPKSINSGEEGDLVMSIVVNCLLLSLFAIQHTIMARPNFKKWITQFISAAAERSLFILLSSLILCLMSWQWMPMKTVIWSVEEGIFSTILTALFWLGWLIVFLSTFMINHFHLFGLDQIWNNLRNQPPTGLNFTKRYLYKFVRHPIMLGFIIAFWATPEMTAGHLLFAVMTLGYMVVGVKYFEEKDLRNEIGEAYEKYQKEVPMFFPFTK